MLNKTFDCKTQKSQPTQKNNTIGKLHDSWTVKEKVMDC